MTNPAPSLRESAFFVIARIAIADSWQSKKTLVIARKFCKVKFSWQSTKESKANLSLQNLPKSSRGNLLFFRLLCATSLLSQWRFGADLRYLHFALSLLVFVFCHAFPIHCGGGLRGVGKILNIPIIARFYLLQGKVIYHYFVIASLWKSRTHTCKSTNRLNHLDLRIYLRLLWIASLCSLCSHCLAMTIRLILYCHANPADSLAMTRYLPITCTTLAQGRGLEILRFPHYIK